MKDKLKLYGPVIILAWIFYMMISTPHSRPLGDILLEIFGLKSWTDGSMGTHLTVIYFGILFIVVWILYQKFSTIEQSKYKYKLLVFICSVTIIYLGHSALVHNRMEQSIGLHSIAIEPSENSYEFKIVDGVIEEFSCEFKLTNYSEEAKQFSIDGFNDNSISLEIFNKQGELAKFTINSKETHIYSVNQDQYIVKLRGIDVRQQVSGSGDVKSLLLSDDTGSKIKIVKLSDLGIKKNY